jgi:hypothetical protein
MGLILVVRGLVGLWFARQLAGVPAAAWERVFDVLADYLLADGALGFVMAIAELRRGIAGRMPRERTLAAVFLIDALGRTASGTAVHVWPGLAGFPVTAVAFIGIMGACTAIVGLTEATLVVEEEVARHGPRHDRPQLAVGPVSLASIVSVVFATAAFLLIGEPRYVHLLLVAYIAAASVVMLTMAWTRRTASHRENSHEQPANA